MSAFEVNFYYKADGSCPVRDFLDTLDDKMLAKLLGTISLLETNGTQLREPYSKSLGDGIFELRAKQSSNITRILYFFVVGHASDHIDERFCQKDAENAAGGNCTGAKISCGLFLSKGELLMSDFRNYLNEQLQRPSFKAEWDALQPELTIAQAMIDARKESGLTQKQLSERTGIAQADISKLERGNANPSLRTLQRLAAGMGMNIRIEFVSNK